MKKLFTFLLAALMSVGMFATTVTWNSSTLSSIITSNQESFTKDGVTLTVLKGTIDGSFGLWMGNSDDASFKFSTSLGNFTKIEITADIHTLGGSGWTKTSPGAVWTGEANETTFGRDFENVSQIVFTIAEPEPEPQPAATEVTITQSDFPESSESTSFTKDGVTVSAATIDGISGYLLGGGSFSTTLGNFTKIEVNAMNIGSLGEGWSGNSEKQTWTGNASSVPFSGDIYGYGQLTLKFTIGEPAPTTNTLQLHVNDAAMGSVALQNPSSDIIDNGDGTYTVPASAEVTILATPNEGYEFSGWKASNTLCDFTECEFVDVNTVDNPMTITMTADVAFMAEFKAAAKVVTITEADFPSDGEYSFTKDGVTITSATGIDAMHNLWYPTFTSSVGNFTKIEISAGDVALTGEGWSGGNTWTGNASSVSTDGDSHVFVFSGSVTITCTIEEAEPQPGTTTVTWDSNTLSSIDLSSGQSFTEDGVTLAVLNGSVYGMGGSWMPSDDDAYKFSTSSGNFTRIEITGNIIDLGGSGWTQTGPGAVWTGDANETTFGGYFEEVSQIVFTIEEPEPEPQPQETVVTITEADYVSGNTITKDGVTLTAYDIAGVGSWYIEGPGTFTNTIGNFTKIEVTTVGGNVYIEGDGWTGDWDKMTWTGNAPTVSFEEDIFGKGEGFSIVCTIVPADEPQPAASDTINWDKNFCMHVDAYYDGDEERIIEANNTKDGIKVTFVGNEIDDGLTGDVIELYDESSILTFTSTVGDFQKIEIYYTENTYNTPAGWTEDATNKKFVWEGTPAAAVNMVKGTGDVDFEIDHIVFIVESQGAPTAVENVQTNQVQGTKFLRDGMLLIEKNGKIYNVMGNEVK